MTSDGRFTRRAPLPNTPDYDLGRKQAEISLQRFHYLRASILHKYRFVALTDKNPRNGQTVTRQGVDFSGYKDFALRPVAGVRLLNGMDGSLSAEDLNGYLENFEVEIGRAHV